jgi:cytochrome c553
MRDNKMFGKKVLFIAALVSVGCLLSACEEEKAENLDQAKNEPTSLGSITVSKSSASSESNKGLTPFRNYDVKGELQIQYAPPGQEINEAVKNVQVVVASRNAPFLTLDAKVAAQRLGKEFIVYCSSCHDDYGNGVIGPSIMDKTSGEVREMIEKYRGDPNANVLMTDVVNRMTEDQVEHISNDIARFNAEVKAIEAGSKGDLK